MKTSFGFASMFHSVCAFVWICTTPQASLAVASVDLGTEPVSTHPCVVNIEDPISLRCPVKPDEFRNRPIHCSESLLTAFYIDAIRGRSMKISTARGHIAYIAIPKKRYNFVSSASLVRCERGGNKTCHARQQFGFRRIHSTRRSGRLKARSEPHLLAITLVSTHEF